MVNEVVKEEKKLLDTDLMAKNEDFSLSISESPKKPIIFPGSESPAKIRLNMQM